MAEKSVKVGQRVALKDKDLKGAVAYVGLTEFAAGKWVGVILDEAAGKNNGNVQGKEYFSCADKHGMFVRPAQVEIIDNDEDNSRPSSRLSASKLPSPRSAATPSSIPKPGSKLPMPGKATSGPTSGRQPSFTNLKAAKARKDDLASTPMKKERSFVEKDFRQTVSQTPNVVMETPSKASPSTSSASTPLTERMEEKVAAIQTQQELMQLKDHVKDLEEKLETLKVKRAKDQEKIKDFEKIQIQRDQLLEFKERILESQSALQKDLQKAKHEAREAVEAKEKHAEEMSELSETVEMAALDKEMAEEKAEALQIELDAAKDKIEELNLDLDIVKAELGDGTEGAGTTHFEMKQLTAQNEKLRETVVKMRDLLAHEKNLNQKVVKELEEKSHSAVDESKKCEKLTTQNEELENTIADLQEQVDAALGAEEMVESLTAKCLDMEDKLAALEEEKEDLEKLHELNEELQENAREVEIQMREDLDLSQGRVREMTRARDAAYEVIADHEKTIKAFREHFKKLQDQNAELRDNLEKETNKPVSSAPAAEMINFKLMFAESKAHSKAIDMELRICEEKQAKQHVRFLSSYMSDSFLARGGDHEAILVLLLIPRMIWKAEILYSQIKEGFATKATIDTVDRATILKGHDVERCAYGLQMMHQLDSLLAQLQQFKSSLETCAPETFVRAGTLYPEMSVHEKSVDFYIELLRKNQLDENVPLDQLEKGLQYFQHIYPLHLASEKIDHPNFLKSHVRAVASALDSIAMDIVVGKSLLASGQDAAEIGTLLKTSESEVNELKSFSKTMKRRMPHDEDEDALVTFPASTAQKMSDVLKSLTPLGKALYLFGRSATQEAGLQGGESGLPPTKLSEMLHQAIDKVYEFNEAGLDTVKTSLSESISKYGELSKAYDNGEWDVTSLPAKPHPPQQIRAEAYKAEIREAEGMRVKIQNKDMDIKDLKLAVRAKAEELSEMQVRKDKAEKRLLDATRDSDMIREKLQRKIDDLQVLLKKKEKDFEVTMEHLQADIDQLEGEKGELKNKIKDITKQTLFKEINKKIAAAPSMDTASVSGDSESSLGPTSMGPSIPAPVRDSPLLKQQLRDTQNALLALKEASYKKQSEDIIRRLAKMKPIVVPKSRLLSDVEKTDGVKEEEGDLVDLERRAERLRAQVATVLTSSKVIDLKKRRPADNEIVANLLNSELQRRNFAREAEQLQLEIARLKASRKIGGEIKADLATFPSTELSRAMAEKEFATVGKIRLPKSGKGEKDSDHVSLVVGREELKRIHELVMA